MLSKAGAKTPWLAAVSLLWLLSGCGDQYRPVVTPINPPGPAPQPQTEFIAISSPGPSAPGVVTVIDAAGDTVTAQATTGLGPFSFALSSVGGEGFNLNSNNNGAVTLNSYLLTGLQTKNVLTSTLAPGANPANILNTTNTVYLIEPYIDLQTGNSTGQTAVATLSATTNPPALQQEIPVAPNPVNFAGNANAARIYAFSQSNTGGPSIPYDACNTPTDVTQVGEAAAIDTATNAVSQRLKLGVCPVYGVMSADNNRVFILNRGSSTVTVINSQLNQLDITPQGVDHSALPVGVAPGKNAGPVHADLYTPGQLLVTANYDDNSISIINVGLDVYGNDAANFGQTRTVKVGRGPVAVTILQDGSKAYVANQIDGTVSVVDLHSYTMTKTIQVFQNSQTGSGATAHPKAIASVSSTPTGKVYVVSSDSSYITAIRTDTDTVSASILLQGFGVDVRASAQTAGGPSNANPSPNSIVISRIGGLGTPCGVNDQSPFCVTLPR